MNAFQRKFVNEVRRCDEMERKLRYIEAEVNKDGVHIPAVKEPPRAPNPREIIDLEVRDLNDAISFILEYGSRVDEAKGVDEVVSPRSLHTRHLVGPLP